ncbi:SGNH/GDSL hydrolase family protein [Lentzea sp.]|uniref:SGNH/GDSL hydrolase family protein n=1 Tax=Lentzea sp. TaxID=56099 RepID=UPI002CF62632|nr:SGNH/GDSL hydrolase family protein [Lentzea sp.]HUQ56257.1 SGNH/GDSL hydrolase family protein [Lentzea sp.]
MTTSPRFALGLAGLLLLSTACSGQPTATGAPGLAKVLFIGDSIAVGEALPMAAAFKASGVEFQSIAAEGGGNVVGPFADEHWQELPGQITEAEAGLVLYQITTYDWGSAQEQRAGYEKLVKTVSAAGAKLVFVTAPPIRPDEFYQPHMAELAGAPDAARAVADASSGQADVLDATEVWGTTYQQTRDGKADRGTDGIHTCPQGAARFTRWLLAELAGQHPGFTPADPRDWANAGWSADRHFTGC